MTDPDRIQITAMTAATSLAITDLIAGVINPSTSGSTIKIPVSVLMDTILQQITSGSNITLAYDTGTHELTINSSGGGETGVSFWTTMAGTPTRASNTTFTITGDYTNLIKKGTIIKWTESATVRVGMVSIPSTYSSPNTTVTIIGDTMASIDSASLKYAMVDPKVVNFSYAGTIGATGTDVMGAFYAEEPYRVIGADCYTGTAGTTNSTTFDINKNGTTMFTTKPTLATTVAASPTPFTADTATSLALNDKITVDVDAVQTTAAIDGYVKLYLFPTRYQYLT
jgi:hypothetical protein